MIIQTASFKSNIEDQRINDLIDSITQSIDSNQTVTLNNLYVDLFSIYKEYFDAIGSKQFKPVLYKTGQSRDVNPYNINQILLHRDIKAIYLESEIARQNVLAQHNFINISSTTFEEILTKIEDNLVEIENQIIVERFQLLKESVVTISDSFNNLSKVDLSIGSPVDVDISNGWASLRAASDQNRAPNVLRINIVKMNHATDGIEIFSDSFGDGLPKSPRAYEGDRFGTVATAVPEGGGWRITAKNKETDRTDPTVAIDQLYVNLNKPVFTGELTTQVGNSIVVGEVPADKRMTPNEFLFEEDAGADSTGNGFLQANSLEVQFDPSNPNKLGKAFQREDFIFVELEPTDEQIQTQRKKMTDSDPRTFWQIEYTPVIEGMQSAVVSSSFNSGQLTSRNFALANGTDNLEVAVIIELDSIYSLSYLTFNPINFIGNDLSNIKILDVSTSIDNTNFNTVDSFVENDLTESSNKILTENQVMKVGLSSRFRFRGQGVWTFKSREVRYIKFVLRQEHAVENPYEIKNVQLLKKTSYSISENKSVSKSSQSAFVSDTNSSSGSGSASERARVTKLVRFSYLETILSELSGQSLSLLAGATSGAQIDLNDGTSQDDSSKQGTGGLGSIIGPVVGAAVVGASQPQGSPSGPTTGSPVGNALGAALPTALGLVIDLIFNKSAGGASSGQSSNSFTDSGYQVNKQWNQPIWARGRYAIGIRDIGMFSKVFVEKSDLYSKNFKILGGLKRAVLNTDYLIPSDFPITENWIESFIVVNGIEHRIAPSNQPAQVFEGEDVPTEIPFEIEDDADVRVHFILKRPSAFRLPNADSLSPFIKSYELRLYK